MKLKRGIVALLIICCFQNLIVYAAEEQQPTDGQVVQEGKADENAVRQPGVEVSTGDLMVFVGGNNEFYIIPEGIEPENGLHVYSQDEGIAGVSKIDRKDVQDQNLLAAAPEEAIWYSVAGIAEGTTQICVEAEEIQERINIAVSENEEDNGTGEEDNGTAGEDVVDDETAGDPGNTPDDQENGENADDPEGGANEALPEIQTANAMQSRLASHGWVTEGDDTYYYDSIGVKCTGIVEINNVLYYFDESTGALFKQGGWIDKGNKKYFCNTEGILYRNQFIKFGDVIYYYMGTDGSVVKGNFTLGDKTYHANSSTGVIRMEAGWIEDDGKKYFSTADGVIYISQFIKFGDTYYYVGVDGSVTKGNFTVGNKTYHANSSTGELKLVARWIEDGGKRYYTNSEGVLYINQFVTMDSGDTYYMGADGSLQKGVVSASDGNLYYADPTTGVVHKKAGWIDGENGKRYFSDATGKLYRNQLITFGSSVAYYMGSDGSVQKGPVKIGSELYFFGQDGVRITTAGWAEYNGKKYFINGNGTLYHDTFISFGSSVVYYMGSDGSVQKGTVSASDGNLYYTDPSTGVLQKKSGWLDYNGKRYFANASGVLYKSQFISFGSSVVYYMGTDGSVQKGVVNANGVLYYADPGTGLIKKSSGWIDYNGKRYFANASGALYKNQFISFGSNTYYMGSDGSVQKGVVNANGVLYYADPGTGLIKKSSGWIDYNGKRYFANASGALYKNQLISFGSNTYYMGSDGSVQKGIVNANGVLYYADPGTGLIKKSSGWLDYNGKRYFANASGALYKNQFISFGSSTYYMGSDGSIQKGVVNANGVLYYADPGTGLIKKSSGWLDYNGKRYFANASGVLYKNQLISFGPDTYYMGSDGSVQKGSHYVNGRWYYFDETTGVMKRAAGWFTSGSGKYYQKADGTLAKGYTDIDGSRYYFNSSGMLASKKGIDVSTYQGNIDWNKVKNDGVEFAFIRVGYRGYGSSGTLVEDPKFKQNIQGATAAGIPVGVYFFSQAITVAEARQEAAFVYNLIKNYHITYPVAFDAEFSSGNPNGRADKLSKSTRTLMVNTFCSEIRNYGYTPMVYAGIYFLRDNLEASLLSGYQLWIPRYNSTLGYNGTYRCWQYSSTGRVNGISGNVDMNVWLN